MDATRATAERHPGYPWLMCGSLGLSALGLYYLLGEYVGWRWDWWDAIALWVAITFGLPGLGGLWEALVLFVAAWNAGAAPVEVAPEAPEPAPASPLVGGYELSESERHTYEGLLRTFQHAAAAGSLTSSRLIPAAFRDWGHWTYWTDLAAKSGYCVKANGVATTLPAGRTYAWVVGEIRKGNVIWPDDDAPVPQPLPHPFSAGLSYKAEAQKVYKGAEKVEKDDDD